jgi:hypothetical protein
MESNISDVAKSSFSDSSFGDIGVPMLLDCNRLLSMFVFAELMLLLLLDFAPTTIFVCEKKFSVLGFQ